MAPSFENIGGWGFDGRWPGAAWLAPARHGAERFGPCLRSNGGRGFVSGVRGTGRHGSAPSFEHIDGWGLKVERYGMARHGRPRRGKDSPSGQTAAEYFDVIGTARHGLPRRCMARHDPAWSRLLGNWQAAVFNTQPNTFWSRFG